MKKLLATFASKEYQPLANLTLLSKRAYAERWGYDLSTSVYEGNMATIGWARFALVAAALETYDEVFWLDADAIIMNQAIDAASFSGDFVIAADLHGLNSGVFIARKSPLVRQLFFAINGAFGAQHFLNHSWGEQAALIHLLSMPPYNKLANYCEQRQINSYLNEAHGWPEYVQGNYQPGDFVLQLAGLPLHRRIELASQFAEQASRDARTLRRLSHSEDDR